MTPYDPGHTIFCRDVCSPELVKHENVHVGQWDNPGASFLVRYLYHLVVNGYNCDNPWEAPAYQEGTGQCS